MSYTTSPSVAIMRECINTPCRGSDLSSDALIDVVRRDAESPARRTGLRSSRKTKAVTFDEGSISPTKSARRRKARSQSISPRKALSQKDGNARPMTADGSDLVKLPQCYSLEDFSLRPTTSIGDVRRGSDTEKALSAQVEDLQDELEERDLKIKKLTELVEFLSTEVKIYTHSLEQQVETQRIEIASLKQNVAN